MGQMVFIANSGGGGGPGTGDVVGPASSNDGTIVLFDGVTGKLIKDSGILPDPFVGDTGLGGQIGFVPAPAAGDAADFKYLNANGTWEQLNEDQILPGFSIASFAKTAPDGVLIYRRADAIPGVNVTASYITGPAIAPTALVNSFGVDNYTGAFVDPTAWTFIAPFLMPTAQVPSVSYDGSDLGADPTWTITLNATSGPGSDSAAITVTWTRDIYWGVSALLTLTGAQVVALSDTILSPTKSRTVTLNPVAEYFYYAFPTSLGTVTMVDLATGFAVGLEAPFLVGITSGIASTYKVYRTTFALTGAFTFQVN
jgi:hypothetical protein